MMFHRTPNIRSPDGDELEGSRRRTSKSSIVINAYISTTIEDSPYPHASEEPIEHPENGLIQILQDPVVSGEGHDRQCLEASKLIGLPCSPIGVAASASHDLSRAHSSSSMGHQVGMPATSKPVFSSSSSSLPYSSSIVQPPAQVHHSHSDLPEPCNTGDLVSDVVARR